VYETEIQNFNDCGDEGENWFGTAAMRRVVNYINSIKSKFENPAILDVG